MRSIPLCGIRLICDCRLPSLRGRHQQRVARHFRRTPLPVPHPSAVCRYATFCILLAKSRPEVGGGSFFHPFCKGQSPLPRFDTVLRRLPFHHLRGILHTIILVNSLRSTGLLLTIQRSSRIGHYLSFLRFLYSKLNRSQLVALGIVARLPGYSHWPFHPWVDEISMATLSSSVRKTRTFKLGCERRRENAWIMAT